MDTREINRINLSKQVKSKDALPIYENSNERSLAEKAMKSSVKDANDVIRMINANVSTMKTKDAYNDFIVRARLDTEKAKKEYYKSIKGVDKDERLALSAKYYKESETAKKNLREIMNKLSQQANDAIDYIKKIDNDVLNSIMK